MDSVDTADIVHTVDTLEIVKSINSVDSANKGLPRRPEDYSPRGPEDNNTGPED